MNRSLVRAGSALLLALAFGVPFGGGAARAATATDIWFLGTHLILPSAHDRGDELMVATNDSGLARVLQKTGATLAFDPAQHYVVITSGDRRTITFTLGQTRVRAGTEELRAAAAPYARDGVAYLPFFTLARALYLQPVRSDGETVLQPQIGALVVSTEGKTTIVALHAAIPLSYKRLSGAANDGVSLAFDGVASQLDPTRVVNSKALAEVDLYVAGDARRPTTTVNFDGRSGTEHAVLPGHSPNEVVLAFGPRGIALHGVPVPAQASPERVAEAAVPVAAPVATPSESRPPVVAPSA
ncbi:MAG: hypothetical protein ACREM8_00475, partial [Vulcanimicrobiaceae bacterium]